LSGRRISIVHDQPGVTRDIISAEVEEGRFLLLDTGGLGLQDARTSAAIARASEVQAHLAMDTADVILFVIDAREGLTSLDERVATLLRKRKKAVILVANKADQGAEKVAGAEEFFRLGFGEATFISSEHGNGEADLRNAILERLGPEPEKTEEDRKRLTICFVGRPNVGKSSLSNRLLKSDRLIVNETPGTTRDSVEIDFDFRSRDKRVWPFRLIDTAGIRPSAKLGSSVEYFSRVRSLDAIRQADVVFMVLDAMDGVTQQDKAIAGEIVSASRPIVVVVNKWDLVHAAIRSGGLPKFEGERDFREKFEDALADRLFFTPGAPVIFVSALTGHEIERMLRSARGLNERLDRKIPTAKLNQAIIRLADRMPPPSIGGQRFRVYYATQTGNRPFRIKVFCNREEKLTEQYRRYLESGLVKEFKLDGCPIHFDLIGKKKREAAQRIAAKQGRLRGAPAGDLEEIDPSVFDD
jgi:GTP-binding protein